MIVASRPILHSPRRRARARTAAALVRPWAHRGPDDAGHWHRRTAPPCSPAPAHSRTSHPAEPPADASALRPLRAVVQRPRILYNQREASGAILSATGGHRFRLRRPTPRCSAAAAHPLLQRAHGPAARHVRLTLPLGPPGTRALLSPRSLRAFKPLYIWQGPGGEALLFASELAGPFPDHGAGPRRLDPPHGWVGSIPAQGSLPAGAHPRGRVCAPCRPGGMRIWQAGPLAHPSPTGSELPPEAPHSLPRFCWLTPRQATEASRYQATCSPILPWGCSLWRAGFCGGAGAC